MLMTSPSVRDPRAPPRRRERSVSRKPKWIACALALVTTATLAPARSHAHHSGAMFDYDRSITLAGTVKQFQWTNPHCWIELSVPGKDGTVEDWSVEMGAPLQLYQGGCKPGTLKAGDEI